MVSVVIKKSDKSGKKLMAVFTRDNGRTKTTPVDRDWETIYISI